MADQAPQRGLTVTLIDGRQVSSWSEEWRAECEARHILRMPSVHDRRAYLAGVRTRRGDRAGHALEELVRAVWAHQRRP